MIGPRPGCPHHKALGLHGERAVGRPALRTRPRTGGTPPAIARAVRIDASPIEFLESHLQRVFSVDLGDRAMDVHRHLVAVRRRRVLDEVVPHGHDDIGTIEPEVGVVPDHEAEFVRGAVSSGNTP